MKSIKEIYKTGKGPSSSHTMGPAKAMGIFISENNNVIGIEINESAIEDAKINKER